MAARRTIRNESRRGPLNAGTAQACSGLRSAPPAAPLVTCKWLGRSGRLGNQMFQVAAAIGVARKCGLEFVFPPWDYAAYFRKPVPQSPQLPRPKSIGESSFAYNDIRVSRSTDLAGCFQSERYFQHCTAEVRSYFFSAGGTAGQSRRGISRTVE